MPVAATSAGNLCYCGSDVPPDSSKVDTSECNTPCSGYQPESCGGTNLFSVYLDGLSANPSASESTVQTTGSTPTPTTSTKPSLVTLPGQTVVVTASVTPTSPSGSSSGGGPSKAGIAAGVVVGIVAAAALCGGTYLFLRNRKRRQVEEEYRRNAAINSFVNAGGKPPTSSGGASSFTDTRLDPTVMAQRRMSDGSIADNQDYSRRILKVTNA